LLLLTSTLGFIVWSHTVPRSQRADDLSAGLTTPVRTVSAISGALVGLFLTLDSNPMIALQQGLGITPLLKPVQGFLIFVLSLLGFLLWSAIAETPSDKGLPRIGTKQNIIGVAAALTVVIALTYSSVSVNAPVEPY